MKLSVIIPAYNSEMTLRKCIDSVINQTLSEIEIIVINDGSKDGTEQILAEYSKRFPDRIRYLTVENGGQGRARNIGMELATGDYIGFVDSDDWIEPDMYERLLTASTEESSDLTICDVVAHFPDGRTTKESIFRTEEKYAAAGFANNKLFEKNLINGIRFPEERLWYEDTEFTAKAIHRARKIMHIQEVLYHYQRGLPSTMNNSNAMKNLDILTVMLHLEGELLPDEKDGFEFLVLNHILLDAMNRVQAMDAPEKKDVLRLLRAYVHEKIPNLSKSQSFQRETRNRRIIMSLHYLGLSDIVSAIMKIKQGRS